MAQIAHYKPSSLWLKWLTINPGHYDSTVSLKPKHIMSQFDHYNTRSLWLKYPLYPSSLMLTIIKWFTLNLTQTHYVWLKWFTQAHYCYIVYSNGSL